MGETQLRRTIKDLEETIRITRKERDAALLQAKDFRASEVSRLRSENAMLQRQQAGALRFKVGAKGGVVIGGLRSPVHPVTLYKRELQRIFDAQEDIMTFVKTNDAFLSQGPDDPRFPAKTSGRRRR